MTLDFSELLASAEFLEETRSAAELAPREVLGQGLVTWSVVIKVDEQLRHPGSSPANALVLHARDASTRFELSFIERLSRFAKPKSTSPSCFATMARWWRVSPCPHRSRQRRSFCRR